MQNHKIGESVESQRCDLCLQRKRKEIESEDPTLHGTCGEVLW